MSLGLWNLEYLNLNEQRAYPLADSATALDVTGTFALPTSFLVGLALPVPVGVDLGVTVDPTRFFLRTVAVLPGGYTVVVAYDDGTSSPPAVARAAIARAAHSEFAEYALEGVGDFADVRGTLAVGTLAEVDLQPAGEWTFDPAGGRLDADAIRPVIRGLASLAVVNGHDTSPRIHGDVTLVAGTNVRLVLDGQTIRIDAVAGAGLSEACACDGTAGDLPPPIRTINGIAPTAGGDFRFVGNKCVRIDGVDHGLEFSDTCSSPCCGCPELAALTQQLAYFGNEAATLRAYVAQQVAAFNQFGAVVLASKLVDAPCA